MPILDLPPYNNDPNCSKAPSPPTPPLPPSPPMEAAIDMGTNSFKLLLARAHRTGGCFLPVDRRTEPVLLGRGRATDGSITPDSQLRAVAALRTFFLALRAHPVRDIRVVATAAVRDAPNRSELLSMVREELGLEVEVLSGEEEARLIYRGVLQFLPLYEKSVLTVDIGGGSTEFVVGREGKVIFATSLNLGHVSLTESFVKKGDLVGLRYHIRTVIQQSAVVDRVRELGFEVAVGSSGTIRSIEKAVFLGGTGGLLNGEFSRNWRFSRQELRLLVEKLCGLNSGEAEGVMKLGFSKRRGEFIVAGSVLLLEIFDALGIAEMEVSGYALREGVVSEMLARGCSEFDMSLNARLRSVVGLAARFDGENRMKSAVQCVGIAKEIFDGIRRHLEVDECNSKSAACLDDKDFEYLEAALLLHNIGLQFGKKGYHKRSYQIIKNGGHLHGYSSEEIELVALLARYHRKKFPRCGHASLQKLSPEMNLKFRVLCVIIRVSHALLQCYRMNFQGLEVLNTRGGFKLVLSRLEDQSLVLQQQQTPGIIDAQLQLEFERFEEVLQKKLSLSIS